MRDHVVRQNFRATTSERSSLQRWHVNSVSASASDVEYKSYGEPTFCVYFAS